MRVKHYHMIGQGSCGMQWMALFMQNSCGMSYPKKWEAHSRNPNISVTPAKILYLTADPYDMMISFEQRGFLSDDRHCKNLAGDTLFFRSNGFGLSSILRAGYDPFQLEDHIKTWMNFERRTYSLMIVKYESLTEHIQDILKFFGAPDAERKASNFRTSHKKRQANWTKASEETKHGLTSVYGSYRDWWLTLDSKILL